MYRVVSAKELPTFPGYSTFKLTNGAFNMRLCEIHENTEKLYRKTDLTSKADNLRQIIYLLY